MSRRATFSATLVWCFWLLSGVPVLSARDPRPAQLGSLTTTVVDSQGKPAVGAEVNLVGYPARARTDAQGRARFDGVKAGRYLVQVASPSGETASREVLLAEGQDLEVTLVLQRASFHEEVVVSAAHPERLAETVRPVSVLAGDALAVAARPSLGETLSREPGVTSTFYSPGSSRPLLRGQGGDRIRLLHDGLEVGDASDTSPDHGVAVAPMGLERVEILRGPAALLYGTETLGGVINLVGGSVPRQPTSEPLAGAVSWSLGSNAWQRAAGAQLAGGNGTVSWQAGGNLLRANDYKTPWGKVKNSFVETDSGHLGAAYFGPWGFVGLGFDHHESLYGSPVEEEVRVDLWRRRWELQGQWHTQFLGSSHLRFALARVEYHHRELEGAEVGTQVQNWLTTSRLEWHHGSWGPFSGILGWEGNRRDLNVRGEETYLPRTDTEKNAVFLWQHGDVGPVHIELGARWDRVRHRPSPMDPGHSGHHPHVDAGGFHGHPHPPFNPERRTFDFASVTASATATPLPPLKLYLAVAVTGKAPNPEELYSHGPHAATGLFEVGDPSLRLERNRNVELGVLLRQDHWSLRANVYRAFVDRFIYQTLTGEVEDEFPVAQFVQQDARFVGGEVAVHWDLFRSEQQHWEGEIGADWTRGTLDSGGFVPRMPPVRIFGRLGVLTDRAWARLGVLRTLAATRTAAEETRTPGFTTFDLTIGYRVLMKRYAHNLILNGTNLADAKALNHTSFFKDKSPLPGRSVALLYQLVF